MLSTLSMAGVPWYFDEKIRAYRIREGFKFSLAENALLNVPDQDESGNQCDSLAESIDQVIEDGETFAHSLESLLATLRSVRKGRFGER
ncbi:hypothetical protein [Novipirellula rosea]|uniref:Uncharacterized protein n=1 Tax=Novipirellula rosea TaxID=1031540 RepID=A0ABP8MA51_9BACT